MKTREMKTRTTLGRAFKISFLIPIALAFLHGCYQMPPTVAFDPALPRTVINGYAFHTETFGDPKLPVAIVIHGGPGGDFEYLRALSKLSDEYFVVFYDQRGTGLSPREDNPTHSIESTVADLDAIIDYYGHGKKVILLGHSFGAMLATAYAGKYPQKVDTAVMMEPGMLNGISAPVFIEGAKGSVTLAKAMGLVGVVIKSLFVKRVDGHEFGDAMMTGIAGYGGGPPYQCVGEELPPHSFVRMGYATWKHTLAPLFDDPHAFHEDLAAGIDRFPGPILLLSSSCSFVGFDFQEKYHRKLYPATALHWKIEGTGHNMVTTKPDETVAMIRRFLAKK